jgi:hypothetical protein
MFGINIDTLVRWANITFLGIFCIYVYSPLHDDPTATLIVRIALFPVVALAATAIWQELCLHLLTRSATLVTGKSQYT